MSMQASDLARRLAEQAETVCRQYLSNGRRVGRYWIVGDVRNTPGRSMFVRLKGPASGKGAAGKWTDAATGEHGDLLDIIRESCGLVDFHDVLEEARRFLCLPQPQLSPACDARKQPPAPTGSPEANAIVGAVADIFDALIATLSDTRLEPDFENLLCRPSISSTAPQSASTESSTTTRSDRKRSQKEQDGSEIRSVELERLVAEGLTLIERRNSMELFRDLATDQFERATGSSWRPRSGSRVNHRTLTAAMIDSRDFLAAKRRAETEPLLPAGPKIAFTGGVNFNDHQVIWDRLDKVRAKHPDMVLLHGGSPKGAERIAARWADHRKVPQIAFKPDWARYAGRIKSEYLTASEEGYLRENISHCLYFFRSSDRHSDFFACWKE